MVNAERVGRGQMSTTPNIKAVGHYGIHWTSTGVAFLEQGDPKGGANALGLREKSPFRVRIQSKFKYCNHNIPLAVPNQHPKHIEMFDRLVEDALVDTMLPIPKDEGSSGVYFIEDPTNSLLPYIALLAQMSSPIDSIIKPIWSYPLKTIMELMEVTNVQPLVLTDAGARDTDLLDKIGKFGLSAPRTVLITGSADVVCPRSVERITTTLSKFAIEDLIGLPWAALGAAVTRKDMRGEWHGYLNPEGSSDGKTDTSPVSD